MVEPFFPTLTTLSGPRNEGVPGSSPGVGLKLIAEAPARQLKITAARKRPNAGVSV
jgi:hypothetical protein